MNILFPPSLQPGDTIGICATARKITRDEIAPAVSHLQHLGLKVAFGKNLFHAEHQFSGTDAERTSDLQEFLDDPQIKAVISARGGYGTMRIIDQLDFSGFKKSPKWIIGYSDITVLHSHIHTNCGIATLHATMPINFLKDEFSTETLRMALFGEKLIYQSKNETGTANRNGSAEAQLIGGNLSLLYALQGSASDIYTNGKILFIEDLDEYLYHIDRMILSLKRAGKLSGLKGLIVGGMNDMKDNLVPFGKNAEQIIAEHVAEFDYPVLFGFPAGHDAKNLALPLGKTVRLEVNGTESCVEFL